MRLMKALPGVASFAIAVSFIPFLSAQQATPKPLQTARQALIEIMSGTGDASKHLTVEVLGAQKEQQARSKSVPEITPAVMLVGIRSAMAGSRVKTFESGPILLSSSDAKSHGRREVHVDNDDLNGEEATLQLSVHEFRDEKETDSPFQFLSQIIVGMKKQEGVWRLNEIGASTKLPVGDPAFFRKLNEQRETGITSIGDGLTAYSLGSTTETSQVPKADIQTTLSLVSFQEQTYAAQHPEQGFICSLSDLMADASQLQGFGLDPQVKTGISNGFRINVTGCQGVPSGSYQITAEPISPSAGNKAFCTDATHNIRASDDGRGATCLASGKVPPQRQPTNADTGYLVP